VAGPAARILSPSPDATDGATAPRGARRGLLVLTAGPVRYFYGRYPADSWTRPNLIHRARVLALFLPRDPIEGRESLKTMPRTEHNWAARRRGELTRDRGSRPLSHAIEARRRLNAMRADRTQTKQDPHASSELPHTYLTKSRRDRPTDALSGEQRSAYAPS
jgi:hypothetical protein